jgi:hypothetical protein
MTTLPISRLLPFPRSLLLAAMWCAAAAFGYLAIPHFGNASLLARSAELCWALAWLAAIAGCAWSIGGLIPVRSLPRLSLAEHTLVRLAAGSGFLALLVLALGVGGMLSPPLLAAALAVGALPALYAAGYYQWRIHRPTLSFGQIVLLGFICAQIAYCLLGFVVVPPTAHDALAYHLGLPKLYLAAGRITYVPFIVHANWPALTEMLAVLGLALRSELLVNLICFNLSVLGGVGLFLLGRRLVGGTVALLACALYASTPVVQELAGVPMVEMVLATYSWLAAGCFALWLRERHIGWLLLAAICAGFAAGVKLTGAGVSIALIVAALLDAVLTRAPFWLTLRRLIACGAIVALLVAPWYLKSALDTGNPLWPFFYDRIPSRNWDALGAEAHDTYLHVTNLRPAPANVLLALWYLATDPGRFGGFGLGHMLLLPLPLFVVRSLLDRRFRQRLGFLLLFCLLIYGQWFALTQQTRFLAPLLPALALLGADTIVWGWRISGRPRILWLITGCLLILALPMFTPAQQQRWRGGALYAVGATSRSTYLSAQVPPFPLYERANAALPPNALVLMLPLENRGYLLDRRYIWGNPVSQRIIRFEQYANDALLASDLCRVGISHILYNDESPLPAGILRYGTQIAAIEQALVAHHTTPILVINPKQGLYALTCPVAQTQYP